MRQGIWAGVLGAALMLFAGVADAAKAIRVDATSAASAERSYQRMMGRLALPQQLALAMAVAQINLQGVHSAYELVNHPARDELGIAPIKDQVAGMTAEEIITLGAQVSTITVEPVTP